MQSVVLDPDHHRGPIDPRLFGSFVEHMGRCVYTGIYEPDHPAADAAGFRRDVAELVRELGVTLLRYPGGNFVSGYDWTDGIGPRAQRPRRLDLAWRSIETNQVGTDEFLRWAQGLGLAPMMAVNLGTAGVREAAALVEYCNVAEGTRWSDLRRGNGSAKPYGVGLWCLGNEMDGPWQTGHKTAEEYGALAAETAKAMRLVDPSIELAACGSSYHDIPTFGYWESTVLERAGEYVDYVSMHAYYQEHDGDRDSFLASGAAMDAFIRDVVSTIDAVVARRRLRRRINISFDEWNIWYQTRYASIEATAIDVSGPRIEDVYSTVDAVVVGDLLATLVNHADRVKVGCLAQLVNVIAPIMTEPGGPAWRQAIFHPFAATAAAVGGVSLVTRVSTGELATRRHGDVPSLAAAASHDPDRHAATVLLTNRAAEPATVQLHHRAFPAWQTRQART
ncbi:MAG TPA: alpha-L-arabinofuranosidase C-terminal domain-containing protein, partial [Rugosimonospora sp.]|nr:alpha-L-arabinofuranosidase C-terminal domain-containing protein [Rugosimonospora sp.]